MRNSGKPTSPGDLAGPIGGQGQPESKGSVRQYGVVSGVGARIFGGCANAHSFRADVNAQNDKGESVLYYLASNRCTVGVDAVRLLIASKADVNATSRLPYHTLGECVQAGIHQMLCEGYLASSGRTPLLEAAAHGTEDFVSVLVEAHADINAQDPKNGKTPLMEAVEHGNSGAVKVLIDAHADLNARARFGETALFFARSNANVTRLLIAAKADLNARDQWGHTALYWAKKRSCEIDLFGLCLYHGADEVADLLRASGAED